MQSRLRFIRGPLALFETIDVWEGFSAIFHSLRELIAGERRPATDKLK